MATDQRSPFHVAVYVPDLNDSSLDALSAWVPGMEGMAPVRSMIYSAQGPEETPISAKILRTAGFMPGSAAATCGVAVEHTDEGMFIHPNPGNRWHHVAFHTDDLAGEVSNFEDQGFVKEAWAEGPDGELTVFAYMMSPQGPRIELTQKVMQQVPPEMLEQANALRAKAAEALKAAVAADLAAGMSPERAEGREIDHIAAIVEDPEAEALRVEKASGLGFADPVESDVTVLNGKEQKVVSRSIQSLGATPIRFIAREGSGGRLPGQEDGWDHVAFRSSQLEKDVEELEKAGYQRLAHWAANSSDPESVLLAAPEGTHVKLVSSAS